MTDFIMVAASGDKYIDAYQRLHEGRIKSFAKRWGAEYILYTEFGDITPHKSLTWTKIWAIRDMLEKQMKEGQVVGVIDADISVVRTDIPLNTKKSMGFTFDLWHASDLKGDIMNGPNNGVLALRSDDFTRSIWKRIWDSTAFDHMQGSQDNLVFNTEIKALSDDDIEKHIEILPRELNVTDGSRIPPHKVRFRHYAGRGMDRWDENWPFIDP